MKIYTATPVIRVTSTGYDGEGTGLVVTGLLVKVSTSLSIQPYLCHNHVTPVLLSAGNELWSSLNLNLLNFLNGKVHTSLSFQGYETKNLKLVSQQY